MITDENKIIFQESRQNFGGLFYFTLLGGVMLVLFSIYGYFYLSDADFPRFAAIGVGCLGLFLILQLTLDSFRLSRAIIDYRLCKVFVENRGLFGNSVKEFQFSEIRGFYVKEDFSPERPAGWYLDMELTDDRQFEICNSFNRDIKTVEEVARSVNEHFQAVGNSSQRVG